MINDLYESTWDILIIGGGINGAGLANLSSGLGLKTILFEKNTFGSGASSKSTKLLHGGIRYLEQGDLGLVYESLHERKSLLKLVPTLAKPLRFIIPVYKNQGRPLWKLKWGVRLYSLLAGFANVGRHQFFSTKETLKLIPGIEKQGLVGGVSYYDVQMDDLGLVKANIDQAIDQGAQCIEESEIIEFIKQNGKTVGVVVADKMTGQTHEVFAKHIVSATGPWSNEILVRDYGKMVRRVRPTKGVHLVYDETLTQDAVLVQDNDNARIFFIIPWKGKSLIGTTDTDYTGDLDNVIAEDSDIQYLLKQTIQIFPDKNIDVSKISETFSGLRPLVTSAGNPSQISRKHVIEQSDSGVWYIMGGKYTTFRIMVTDCLNRILGKKVRHEWNFPA